MEKSGNWYRKLISYINTRYCRTPCAQIIYDRFHIAKHLNDTMNHVRIHVFNRLRKGDSAE
ncbi:transposase [Limosilactobacillus reuteri]|nr:transposase [Limosilactobacillus reuteri]